jgi:hypothetical protein
MTADREPLDLIIVLEIVKYLRLREERSPQPSADSSLILEIVKNLPEGITISSLLTDRSSKVEEITMGDRYEVGQAGAVGPQSVAVGQHFVQIWNKTSSDVNLQELAQELRKVREKGRTLASGTPEDDLALAEVANAELAAQQDDGAKAMSHLARAGQWALDIAKQVGVPIAIKALESAMSS